MALWTWVLVGTAPVLVMFSLSMRYEADFASGILLLAALAGWQLLVIPRSRAVRAALSTLFGVARSRDRRCRRAARFRGLFRSLCPLQNPRPSGCASRGAPRSLHWFEMSISIGMPPLFVRKRVTRCRPNPAATRASAATIATRQAGLRRVAFAQLGEEMAYVGGNPDAIGRIAGDQAPGRSRAAGPRPSPARRRSARRRGKRFSESRSDLVERGRQRSARLGFSRMRFVQGTIGEGVPERVHMVLARGPPVVISKSFSSSAAARPRRQSCTLGRKPLGGGLRGLGDVAEGNAGRRDPMASLRGSGRRRKTGQRTGHLAEAAAGACVLRALLDDLKQEKREPAHRGRSC